MKDEKWSQKRGKKIGPTEVTSMRRSNTWVVAGKVDEGTQSGDMGGGAGGQSHQGSEKYWELKREVK